MNERDVVTVLDDDREREVLATPGAEETMGTALEASRMLAEECGAGPGSVQVPAPLAVIEEEGGWWRGEVHLVVCPRGDERSDLLVQSAVHAARLGYEVHLVSTEKSTDGLVPLFLGERLTAYVTPDGSRVTVARVYRRDPSVRGALEAALRDTREALERVFLRGVDLILVDSIEPISVPGHSAGELEARAVVRALVQTARSLNAAVVVAAERAEGDGVSVPLPEESRDLAFIAALVLELERLGEEDGRSETVPYALRVVKSRFSESSGRRAELVFDLASHRFRQKD